MGCGDRSGTLLEEHTSNNTRTPTHQAQEDLVCREVRSANPNTKFQRSNRDVDDLSNVDHPLTNASSSQDEAQLYSFEDYEALIKMFIKARSITMRHVSRTHRVALVWLFDRVNVDPKSKLDFSLLNSVKYDSSLISFSAPWPVNSFLISANNLFNAFTVSKISEFFNYAATVFFLPELILHKCRCGVQSNFSKCAEKVGSSDASSNALQYMGVNIQGNLSHS